MLLFKVQESKFFEDPNAASFWCGSFSAEIFEQWTIFPMTGFVADYLEILIQDPSDATG